jgi:hypothetical protein
VISERAVNLLRAPTQPVAGLPNIIELHASLAAIYAESRSKLLRYCLINGLPGFVTIEQGNAIQTTALLIEDGKTVGIYVMRNPDKLRHRASDMAQQEAANAVQGHEPDPNPPRRR